MELSGDTGIAAAEPSLVYATVVTNVKALIGRLKKLQKDVAAEAGVDPSTVSRWLSGGITSQSMTRVMHTWASGFVEYTNVASDDTTTEDVEEVLSLPVVAEAVVVVEDDSGTQEECYDISDIARGIEQLTLSEKKRTDRTYHPKDRRGFVYLIHDGRAGKYKVGRAKDPDRRIGEFHTAAPQLKLKWKHETGDMVCAEDMAHNLLRHSRDRSRGPGCEWFSCTEMEARVAIMTACAQFPVLPLS